MVRIGCSGWSYDDWRGVLYPERGSTERWLELYAETFDTVEVNATFYRLPTVALVERWAKATPADFCFAVKASRYLTHVKRLRDLPAGVARFEERIQPLRAAGKLGPVLWQLPATFHRDVDRLAAALDELPPGRNAFEPRHESWFAAEVYELLRVHGVALVTAHRSRGGASPDVDTAGWRYIRLHHGRGRNGRYTERELRDWASSIRELRGDAYVYFNNDWEGLAVENARRLHALLESDLATDCEASPKRM